MYKKRLNKQMAILLGSIVIISTCISAYVPEKTSNKYTSYRTDTKQLEQIRLLESSDEQVAENEHLILYVNEEDLSIKVYDKQADYYYSSNDLNEEGLNSYWKNYVNSPITIKTLNSKMQIVQENIYDSSKSKAKILSKNYNGFTAEVYFDEAQITIVYSVTLEGQDIVLSIKDDQIKEEATSVIVAKQKEEQEELEQNDNLSALEKALAQTKEKIESHDLYGIQIYPFFGAVEAGEQDGYTLIPDGSGGLIRYDKVYDKIIAPYEHPYLEADYGINRETQGGGYNTDYYQSLLMPLYGMIHGIEQAGIIVISELGYENARIISYPAGLFTNYYFTTNEYRFNGMSQQELSETQRVTVKLEERLHYDIQERIHFLAGEEATYTGQAHYYKNYLLEKQALNTVEIQHNPLVIETSMGVVEKGIFGNKVVPFTTTDEIVELDQYFKNQGISSTSYILKDATVDLYTGDFDDREKVHSRLEGKYSFEEMNAYLLQNNSKAFIDADIATIRGNIDPDDYGVRRADKNYVIYDYPLGNKRVQMMVLNAEGILKANEANRELVEKYGFAGVNTTWGVLQTLYTNNGKEGIETRIVSIEAQRQSLEKIVADGFEIQGGMAPFYALEHLTGMQHTPVNTTQYAYVTDTVPFLQIVLAGNIPMHSYPVNHETDLEEAFLRSVEYHVYPTFEVSDVEMNEIPPIYQSPAMKTRNHMLVSDWSEEIVDFYTELDQILSQVKNQYIVTHEVIAPSVVKVGYANNKHIIINYGERDFNYNGTIIEKRGCEVI